MFFSDYSQPTDSYTYCLALSLLSDRTICRDALADACAEAAHDGLHLWMSPRAVRIACKLPVQISNVETRETWRTGPVTLTVNAIAGETRAAGTTELGRAHV